MGNGEGGDLLQMGVAAFVAVTLLKLFVSQYKAQRKRLRKYQQVIEEKTASGDVETDTLHRLREDETEL